MMDRVITAAAAARHATGPALWAGPVLTL